MNDDLILLISYVDSKLSLHKIVLTVEHGMNDREWINWKYYEEDSIQEIYKNALPLYIKNHVNKIIHVEKIFQAIIKK